MRNQILITFMLIFLIYIFSLNKVEKPIIGTEKNIIEGEKVFTKKEKINIFKWVFNEKYRMGFIEGAVKNEKISGMGRNK